MASLSSGAGEKKEELTVNPLITNILAQYVDEGIVRVEPLSNTGQKNAGIYKLCKSEYLDKKDLKQLLQNKLLELQQKLGEEQENINSFYTEFSDRYTAGKINMRCLFREASALIITGKVTLTELEGLLAANLPVYRKARFRQRLESKKSLDHLATELAQMPAEQVTEEYIDDLFVQLISLGDITTIDPRIRVDISYQNLEKEALDTKCPYILKLDTDIDKIQSEIVIQKMVNEINANITPMVIDADIKTFLNGDDTLYGFAMELIRGRPICEGCADGDDINFSIAQNKYKGFSRNNTGQLITIIQQLHANNIVHNDLNLENIIISPSGKVKIIDWGESKSYSSAQDKLDEIFDKYTGLYTRICKLLGRATTQDAKATGARDYTLTLKYLLDQLDFHFSGETTGIKRCAAIGLVKDGNNGGGGGSGGSSSKKGGGKRKTKRRRKRNKKRYKTRRGKKRNTKRKTKRRVSRRTKRRRKNN